VDELHKMCGIIGVFCDTDTKISYEMFNGYKELSSRGPDSGTLLIKNNNFMGFRRLSINDMSDIADQPMISYKNGVMVNLMCNGEIYNHKVLEKKFNITCKSSSDCEVIIKLYKEIGFYETVKLLDGDFAIVITDGDMVYMARDRMGVRPLFTGFTKDGDFAVASVAKVLLPFCNNVKQLEPCMISYDKKTHLVTKEYYKFPIYNILEKNQYSIIKETLIQAVSKRLMSDRSVGCLLSGGLDSSLVTSILCKVVGSSNVRTYSIGMEGSTDLKYAQIVANYLGTKHTEVIFTEEEGINAIPEVIEALESYDITTIRASVGMYLLGKYIKENTNDKVILSGEGSDELLCGYLYFHKAPTPSEAAKESYRLMKDLYKYDVLRADRTISVHGLELRVPFLDKNFIDVAVSLTGEQKMPLFGYEKYILRKSFEGDYLPDEVLWRRKEGFSDGVSSTTKSWYQIIQEYVDKIVSNQEFENYKDIFPSKEAFWYKKLFDNYFPSFENPIDYYWMPKWTNSTDPSGRLISVKS
jgi:asparagine synthase (glutamine-hydrolysing)